MNDFLPAHTRKRASLGCLSINQLSYTNPWIIIVWSFFFPGFGYILLGEYLQGWILIAWEIFVNVKSHFNTAIMFALTGRFEESINILRSGGNYWIILYGTVFGFSLFGSYSLSVEENNLYTLAYHENSPIEIFHINSFQFNFVGKRKPWIAALWSILMPGLGEMYTRRIPSAMLVLVWWIFISCYSHGLAAIVYTFTGNFERAVSVLDPEWALFLPSVYGFTFYNSYVSVAEQSKLFDKMQGNFLKSMYQSQSFPFRLEKKENKMRIISTFEHSIYLEKAIVCLERQGISKEQIFAAPLNKQGVDSSISLDTLHRSNGKSFLDIPTLLGSFFCALGTIYGFVLPWGPVLWGLIGFFGGLILGCIIKISIIKLSGEKKRSKSKTEVVLMIDCEKEMGKSVEQILWEHQAFGVSKIDFN